jgi:hypothetical protein
VVSLLFFLISNVLGALGSSILILAFVNIAPGTFDHIALVTPRICASNSNSDPCSEVQKLVIISM